MKPFNMQKTLGISGAVLAFSGSLAWGAVHDFTIDLSALQQVPTNASPGTGTGTATFDDVSNMLSWDISWTNLTDSATGMHFHGPAGVGTNAGVQVNIGAISGTTSPTIGSAIISPSQGTDLLTGLWYVNIHTAAFPGGEIRGQVNPAPPPSPDVVVDIGTLGTGETVTIQFEVTLNEPFPAGFTSVMNQATISGSNFATVLTDDPGTTNVGDATTTVLPPDLDFGDAPTNYPVLLADDGARHVVPFGGSSVFLGAEIDIETNGLASVAADGDDLDGSPDDEDGVLLPAVLAAEATLDLEVVASTNAVLNAWIDFDTDGTWDQPGEQIAADAPMVPGTNLVAITVPATSTSGTSFARFRLSSMLGLPTTGEAPDGEVEDYEVTFSPATADLTLTKSASTSVVAGTMLSYTLSVTNAGPGPAIDVEVVDTLPPGVTPTGPVTNNLGTIASGASTSIVIQVTVDSDTLGTLTNSATVSSAITDTNLTDNTAMAETVVSAEADLTVTKTAPATGIAGTTLTYSLGVTNAGPSDATGVELTDTLPAGVTPGSPVVTNLGTLAAGSATSITIQVTVDSGILGALTNNAAVTTTAIDTNLTDNTTNVVTDISAEAELGITQSDSPDPVIAGTPLTYTLVVTNAGPSDATGTVVTNALPSGVTPTGVVITNLGTLAAGGVTSFTIQVDVDSSTLGTLTNVASVTSDAADPGVLTNTATEATTVNTEADLALAKTAPTNGVAGTSLTYTLSVTNAGPSDALSVVVTDTLPSGVTPGAAMTNSLGTISSGASTSYVIQVTIDDDIQGTITNVATVASSTLDTNAVDNDASVETVVEEVADLSAIKTSSTNSVIAGLGFDWLVTVSNAGPSVARNAVSVDTLPAGVTPTGAQTNHLGTLGVNAVTSFTYSVTVDPFTASNVVNVVAVSTDADDPVSGNDVASNEVAVVARTTWVDRDFAGNLVITDIAAGGKPDDLRIELDTGANEIVLTDTGALFVATIGTTTGDFTSARVPTADVTGAVMLIDLRGSNDLAAVDFSNGAYGLGVLIEGGAGDNELTLLGTQSNDEFYVFSNMVTGTLDAVSYTNFDNAVILGRAGSDNLTSFSGDKVLDGGPGNDTYIFYDGWGNDTIVELPGEGFDIMDFSNITTAMVATVRSIEVTDGIHTAVHADAQIEVLITGSGADEVFVEAYTNVLSVQTGNGIDQVTVGTGTLDGVTRDVSLDGGNDIDLLFVRDGADTNVTPVALSAGLIDRTPAASVSYHSFELLELDLNNDQLSGPIGDGPGGLLLVTVSLSGNTELTSNVVVGSEVTVLIETGSVFTGTGNLTNLGAIVLPTNEVEFGSSLTLADGGLLVAPGGQSLTLSSGGDFTHESGNPNNNFIRGGVIFTGNVAHVLSANAVDQGSGLAGFNAGNRGIGVLDLQADATANGTIYIWEIRGTGNLVIPPGTTVYYGTTVNWSGMVSGGGAFLPIEFGFTDFDTDGATDMLEWESQPGFTSEIYVIDDLLTGTPQVVTGFVGSATLERLTTPSANTNEVYQLQLRP